MYTSFGLSRVNAGEYDSWRLPDDYRADGTRPGVLWVHGAGGTATAITKPDLVGQWKVASAIAAKYPTLCVDAAGESWGNAASSASLLTAKNYLQATLGARAGGVFVVGVSMGGVIALNFEKANPGAVLGQVGLIPCTSMYEAGAGRPGFGFYAAINTAYSTWNWTTHGPTRDPRTYAPTTTLAPYQGWWGTADTIWAEQSAAEWERAANVEKHLIVGGTHSEETIAAVDTAQVMAFLDRLDN
jgi:pimeloyl-ACP methyl ester carboxylesterase